MAAGFHADALKQLVASLADIGEKCPPALLERMLAMLPSLGSTVSPNQASMLAALAEYAPKATAKDRATILAKLQQSLSLLPSCDWLDREGTTSVVTRFVTALAVLPQDGLDSIRATVQEAFTRLASEHSQRSMYTYCFSCLPRSPLSPTLSVFEVSLNSLLEGQRGYSEFFTGMCTAIAETQVFWSPDLVAAALQSSQALKAEGVSPEAASLVRLLASGVEQVEGVDKDGAFKFAGARIAPGENFNAYLQQLQANVELMVASASQSTAATVLDDLQAMQSSDELRESFDIRKVNVYKAWVTGAAVLGTRFQPLQSRVLQMLRDFLFAPSEVLLSFQSVVKSENTTEAMKASSKKAIQELCDACLAGITQVLMERAKEEPSCVQGFLEAAATKLMLTTDDGTELERTKSNIVNTNAIVSLSRVAVGAHDVEPRSIDLAGSMLNQKFMRPPSTLDGLILGELASLAVQAPDSNFDPITTTLVQMAWRTVHAETIDADCAHLIHEDKNAAVDALSQLAGQLQSPELLERLLVQLLIRFKQMVEENTALDLDSLREHARRIGVLVPVMGELSYRLYDATSATLGSSHRSLFQTFWALVGVTGDTFPEVWGNALGSIALCTPPLSDNKTAKFLQKHLESQSAVFAQKLTQRDIAALRNKLDHALMQQGTTLASDVRLDLANLVYFLSIFTLEERRVSCSQSPDFVPLSVYAADQGIMTAQPLMMRAIATSIFQTLIASEQTKRRRPGSVDVLETLTVFLLTNFNHRAKSVRELADHLLSDLTNKFPYLLWSGKVITSMLSLLDLLDKHNDSHSVGSSKILKLPHPPHKLILADFPAQRTVDINNYSQQCKAILKVAFKFAAKETAGHLRQFISNLKAGEGLASLRLLQELQATILAEPDIANDAIFFGPELGMHSSREAKVATVKSLFGEEQYKGWTRSTVQTLQCLAEQLHNSPETIVVPVELQSDVEKDKEAAEQSLTTAEAVAVFEDKLFDASAALLSASDPGMQADLMHAIVWCPVQALTADAMVAGVRCWQWISAKAPALELALLTEQQNAWSYTVDAMLGLFSDNHGSSQGIEQVDFVKDDNAPDGKPHAIWLSFLSERLDVSLQRSAEHMGCFVNIAHKSLRHPLCLHISMVLARYRLFNFAFRLLRPVTEMDSIHKTLLRDRVYCAVLKTFSVPSKLPTTAALDSEVAEVIALWKAMSKDKKACKKIDEHRAIANAMAGDVKAGSAHFVKTRQLVMLLVRYDMELLATWRNPTGLPNNMVPGEDVVRASRKPSPTPSDRTWQSYAKLAWNVDPHIAVQLVYRYQNSEALFNQVAKLVQKQPSLVSDLPEALHLLVTRTSVAAQIPELYEVLLWAPVAPITALNLLREYPGHPILSQYAINVLKSFNPETILFNIPQLVQVLRYDSRGYVAEYMLEACKESQLLAHQMIWNMNTNIYTDDDGEKRDEQLADILEKLVAGIVGSIDGPSKQFYEREFDFFNQITAVSGKIRDKPLGPERRAACLEELAKIKLQPGCYLPSNPRAAVISIDYKSGRPMQSAAKAPYLAAFRVKEMHSLEDLEKFDVDDAATHDILKDGPDVHKQACIFKVGDDCRQDMLALQIIDLCKRAYEALDLDVYLEPYKVVATAPGCGVIQCVPNAQSRQQLGEQTDDSLDRIFVQRYGDEASLQYQEARNNFIKSMAAYSVVTYLLQIKDRHNGNIMIDTDGHIIHIDFGFLFESSPGGNIGFEPDFKLTQEMVTIMGGDQTSAPFLLFRELCARAYLAVRPYREQVVSTVSLMLDTGLPCFRTRYVLNSLRQRFQPDSSAAEAAAYMMSRVDKNTLNFRTKGYDWLQYQQNKIPY